MLNRYFLRFSYDGTAYAGWQIQANALSIQEVLNLKLSLILREEINTTGAGRTDTGVHAKEMYCHFDTSNTDIKSDRFIQKLNRILPADIAGIELIKVNHTAHARFDAISRTYEYFITCKKDPFLINRANYVRVKLDLKKMNAAAQILPW